MVQRLGLVQTDGSDRHACECVAIEHDCVPKIGFIDCDLNNFFSVLLFFETFAVVSLRSYADQYMV